MGIYDRDYGREDAYGRPPGIHVGGPRLLTTNLILVMVGVYVIQLLTRPGPPAPPGGMGWFTETFSLYADFIRRPWQSFQLVTYGFLHDPNDLRHIVFNLLVLFFFGRAVETRYGPKEFLAFFLAAVAFSGLVWVMAEFVSHRQLMPVQVLGASGALAGVLLLFALNFPHQQVFIWGLFPLPAWVFAILFVVIDILGAVNRSDNVAYTAHLGGAVFGLVYFRLGRTISGSLPNSWHIPTLKRKPRLRVHDPEAKPEAGDEEVDEILRKIQEHGQDSLSRRERRILERASREYQRKRRP